MSANHNNQRGKRINYHQNKNKSKYQPRRGGPGIILTCETGRDGKAKREGIEIMRYYYNLAKHNNDGTGGDEKQPASKLAAADPGNSDSASNNNKEEEASSEQPKKALSLEDELAQLKSENKTNSSSQHPNNRGRGHGPFAVYETGCKGTVFVLCTAPDCALIPKIVVATKEEEANHEEEEDGEPSAKKPKTEPAAQSEEKKNTATTNNEAAKDDKQTLSSTSKWDPVETVRSVMDDLRKESTLGESSNKGIPGSRFVSRMIPMQATCFASIEEITATFRSLLDHVILPKIEQQKQQQQQPSADSESISFGVKFKKRNCGNVTRSQVIDAIVLQIDDATNQSCKVNLDKPDYRVEVQVCKTICGISILAANGEDAFMTSRKFNLAELRAAAASENENETNDNEKGGE